jgi:hexosaminidase
LVNGVRSDKGITSTDWLGWRGSDMDAIIDLGKPVSVSRVVIHALNKGGSRVYSPNNVLVMGSTDGKNFSPLGSSQSFEQDKSENSGNITVKFAATKVRYIQVTAKNYDKIPEGKTGAGEPALMLVDEIEIN